MFYIHVVKMYICNPNGNTVEGGDIDWLPRQELASAMHSSLHETFLNTQFMFTRHTYTPILVPQYLVLMTEILTALLRGINTCIFLVCVFLPSLFSYEWCPWELNILLLNINVNVN